MNTVAQSNMSVMNLQKNLEWIVQNYPDLDRVIKPVAPIKKDSLGSVNFSRSRYDSSDFVQSSETELMHIKMMTDLLEGQKKIEQAMPIEGPYIINKNQHFDRKFSTVKPQDFQEKLVSVYQYEKEKSSSSQISSAQKLQPKSGRDSKPQSSNSIHKEANPMPSQSAQVQKLYPLRNSATQFYTNNIFYPKKNLGDNLFYYDDNEEITTKLKKSNPISGSQSTRNFQTSSTASGKRSPSFAFSKTPKVSVFSQQVNLVNKHNKFQ